MDIQEFAQLLWRGVDGTFTVKLEAGEWKIEQVTFSTGYQVGVGNVAIVGLSSDGESIDYDDFQDRVYDAVSDFYYGGLLENERFFGAWVENRNGAGDATLWLDKSVWVADQLSANITGAVLGEKEIYDWANDKCLTVVKSGN